VARRLAQWGARVGKVLMKQVRIEWRVESREKTEVRDLDASLPCPPASEKLLALLRLLGG
jgi:hypothetical protein